MDPPVDERGVALPPAHGPLPAAPVGVAADEEEQRDDHEQPRQRPHPRHLVQGAGLDQAPRGAARVRPPEIGHQPVPDHHRHDAATAQEVDEAIPAPGLHGTHATRDGRPRRSGQGHPTDVGCPLAARRYPAPVSIVEEAPVLDPGDAQRIVADLWGLPDPRARDLGSHQDRNFLITTADARFVLKVANIGHPRRVPRRPERGDAGPGATAGPGAPSGRLGPRRPARGGGPLRDRAQRAAAHLRRGRADDGLPATSRPSRHGSSGPWQGGSAPRSLRSRTRGPICPTSGTCDGPRRWSPTCSPPSTATWADGSATSRRSPDGPSTWSPRTCPRRSSTRTSRTSTWSPILVRTPGWSPPGSSTSAT